MTFKLLKSGLGWILGMDAAALLQNWLNSVQSV